MFYRALFTVAAASVIFLLIYLPFYFASRKPATCKNEAGQKKSRANSLFVETGVGAELADTPENKLSELQVLVETPKYRLVYPAILQLFTPLEEILKRIDLAFSQVEKLMGKFKQQILIFVPPQIVIDDPDFPEDLSIGGMTFEEDEQIVVWVALSHSDVGTFAHELVHARFRDLGIEPPSWLEEGLAHFCDTQDGFNPELFETLMDEGLLSLDDETLWTEETDDQEMQRRATGWAVVYYLVNVVGLKHRKIAKLSEFPAEVDIKEVINQAALRRVLANTNTTTATQ